ncbi:MAG: cell division protein SepF [Solobacterium sp.]|nr:cell division protein SepF [Solobacterium sp.]
MSFVESIIHLVTVEEPDDEEETVQAKEAEKANGPRTALIPCHISLFSPCVFEEVSKISEFLKTPGTAAVISAARMSKEEAQRLVDFMHGAMYMTSGKIVKIGSDEYLCAHSAAMINEKVRA